MVMVSLYSNRILAKTGRLKSSIDTWNSRSFLKYTHM